MFFLTRMNKELGGYVSSLGLEHTIVEPIPPRPDLVTLSALARHSGMRKVGFNQWGWGHWYINPEGRGH